jgi:AcrR family transcriptional regulator
MATTRVKSDKGETILQAAWRLIRHYGYGKTTIADIAAEAGVGKGTVYLYFRSKEEIMLALVDLTGERISRDLERIAAGPGSAAARLQESLLHRVMTIRDLVHRYPHGEDVISSIKPAIVGRIERHLRRQGEILEGLLREGIASGEMAVADPGAVAQLLAGLFELLTPPYYRFPSRGGLERFARQLTELLLRGLATRDGNPMSDRRCQDVLVQERRNS